MAYITNIKTVADAINYVAAHAAAHPQLRYVVNCSWKMNGDHAGVHNAILNALTRGRPDRERAGRGREHGAVRGATCCKRWKESWSRC